MPNMYAHYLAAAKSLDGLQDTALSVLIARRRSLYNLGAQGPDIFYFHRSWPWTPRRRLRPLADLLHTQRVAQVYKAAVAYIRAADHEPREALTAYLCGYAHHHALDATAHPYIYYKTGDTSLAGPAGRKHSLAHSAFEVALDIHLLRMETGKQPSWLIGQNILGVTAEDAQTLAGFWPAVVGTVYDNRLSGAEVLEAIADTRGIATMLLDTGPSLRWLLVLAVATLDRSGRAHASRYRRTPPGGDHLNLAHQPWLLPWDGAVQTSSFLDVHGAAVAQGRALAKALAAAIVAPHTAAMSHYDNRSFDIGLDCSQRPQLRFFDPAVGR